MSDAIRDFVERAFVLPAPPGERERTRREALDEANRAELVIEADGTIVSRAGDAEFYRVRLAIEQSELDALRFEKPDGSLVTLAPAAPGRLVAYQPNRPPAEFVLVPA